MKTLLISLLALFLNVHLAFAQDLPVIKGETKKANDKSSIGSCELKFMKANKVIGFRALDLEEYKTITADKKGKYRTTFEFNNYYRVICSKDGFITMFFDIDARLPKNKKAPEIPDGIDMELNFFTADDGALIKLELLDKFPIEIWKLNPSGNGFKPDLNYRAQLQKGIIVDKEWAKEEKRLAAEKKAQEDKEKAEKELERKNKKRYLSAKVYLKGNGTLPMPSTKVFLYKENPAENPNAQPLEVSVTNPFGKFTFKEIKADETYYIAVEGVDETSAPFLKIKNKNGSSLITENAATVAKGSNGKIGILSFVANDQLLSAFEVAAPVILISGNILLEDADKTPLNNVKVLLKDISNKIIQTTRTNAFGGFAFTNINPDEKYIISVEETDPAIVANKKVSIVNKSGQLIYSTTADAQGKFNFELLPEDKVQLSMLEVDDTELRISLKGKLLTNKEVKTPLKNSNIFLCDQNGKAIKSTKTNENGIFVFENISSDVAYLVNLDANDPNLKTVTKVYLEDEYGNFIKEIIKDALNKFTYQLLPTDLAFMQQVEVVDPWLDLLNSKANLTTIAEPIYFKSGDDHILNEATVVLNKVANIMKAKPSLKIEVGSHTDALGSDAYNMELSNKRAKAAVNYLISKGVKPENLKAVGYGETKLKNNCGNNVKCSDAEHAQNRRIEFKIIAQ